MELEKLPYDLTICKLASVGDLDTGAEFFFFARTGTELSLVCKTGDAPPAALCREDGWRGFFIRGTLYFSLVGVLSELSGVLAKNGIGIFAVSTYDTDYILVKREDFERALAALEKSGHTVL